MFGAILLALAGASILSTVSDAAAYGNMKRSQKEAWEKSREARKASYAKFAKEHDCYWRASEDPYALFFPDVNRHYDGTPR